MSETATISRGHDWGHRRIGAILLIYKSMSYDVGVWLHGPPSKAVRDVRELPLCQRNAWKYRENLPEIQAAGESGT